MNDLNTDEQAMPHEGSSLTDRAVVTPVRTPDDCDAPGIKCEKMTFRFPPGTGARMARLNDEWSFTSNTQLLMVAMAFLDQQTQLGLHRLEGLVLDGK